MKCDNSESGSTSSNKSSHASVIGMNSFRKPPSPELEALSASPNLPRDHRSWPLGFRRMKQSLPQRLVSDGRNRTCPLGKNSSSRMLRALCVFAVNARQHFHREDAKDAKKTLRRSVLLRLGCSLLICGIRGCFFSHGFTRIQFFMASDPIRQRQRRATSGPLRTGSAILARNVSILNSLPLASYFS